MNFRSFAPARLIVAPASVDMSGILQRLLGRGCGRRVEEQPANRAQEKACCIPSFEASVLATIRSRMAQQPELRERGGALLLERLGWQPPSHRREALLGLKHLGLGAQKPQAPTQRRLEIFGQRVASVRKCLLGDFERTTLLAPQRQEVAEPRQRVGRKPRALVRGSHSRRAHVAGFCRDVVVHQREGLGMLVKPRSTDGTTFRAVHVARHFLGVQQELLRPGEQRGHPTRRPTRLVRSPIGAN
mmetsp:Transcript_88069/g.247582  ORF Transcript_88069/g.247582 Transcript_88069/m.247582 type:complete len:244 (+) Transcript_88069:69-800(+)